MASKILQTLKRRIGGRRVCAMPTRCRTTRGVTFDELMAREWEELVIQFDKEKGDYEFRTACCAGAPAC